MDKYQKLAQKFILPTIKNDITYLALGLCGEAGEVANKIKKLKRDNKNILDYTINKEIMDELGDVLWYISILSKELGWDLSEVAEHNLNKLETRHNPKAESDYHNKG